MTTKDFIAGEQSSSNLSFDKANKLPVNENKLTDHQRADFALLAMMNERSNEQPLPIESTFSILNR